MVAVREIRFPEEAASSEARDCSPCSRSTSITKNPVARPVATLMFAEPRLHQQVADRRP